MLAVNNVYCGDCLELLKEVDDNSIALVVTSPPYFNARDYSSWPTFDDYCKFINAVMSELKRCIMEGGFICWNVSGRIICNGTKYSLGFASQAILEKFFSFYDIIVWVKQQGTIFNVTSAGYQKYSKDGGRPVRLIQRHEFIYVYFKGKNCDLNKSKVGKQTDKNFLYWSNVLSLPGARAHFLDGGKTRTVHTAPFSEVLASTMIDWFLLNDGIVLDPFGGSGTVGAVSNKLGNDFILFELNSGYCEACCRRMGIDGYIKDGELVSVPIVGYSYGDYSEFDFRRSDGKKQM